jgi:hypothetical protein
MLEDRLREAQAELEKAHRAFDGLSWNFASVDDNELQYWLHEAVDVKLYYETVRASRTRALLCVRTHRNTHAGLAKALRRTWAPVHSN